MASQPHIAPFRMYFVYVLVCLQTGRSYVGQTDDLVRRYRMHCAGSTRTTREKIIQPFVAYWEMFPSRVEAMRKERYYKAGSGQRVKQNIIAQAVLNHSSVG